MTEKLEIPKFSNDSEEAEWWYKNRDFVNDQLEEAFSEGHLQRGVTDRSGATPTKML